MKLTHMMTLVAALVATAWLMPPVASAYELITKKETVTIEEMQVEIKKTADNFLILCDTSSSMGGNTYKKTGKKKIVLQKEVLKARSNQFINLGFNAGLYTFSPGEGISFAKVLTPLFPVAPYEGKAFAAAIDKLPIDPAGTTPLQRALEELDPILAGLQGHTVVFLMTDGTYSESEDFQKPIDIAKKLASKHDVSFYVIDISGEQDNPQLAYAVNSINARSRVINFDQFLNDPLFVSGALFIIEKNLVKKSVDIEKVIGAKLDHLLFAFDSAEIDPKYSAKLDKLGKYLQENPGYRLALSAFTDSRGLNEYNLDLSKRRVESIAKYMETKFKIPRERMTLNFYGEANPVAPNDTDENREKNRRIEGFVWVQ